MAAANSSPSPSPSAGCPKALLLKGVHITNMRGFQDVEVSFETSDGKPRGMTLVLGNNGSGKSTFLRALAIGLCQQKEASSLVGRMAGEFIRVNKRGNRQAEAQIQLDLVDPLNRNVPYRITTWVRRDDSDQELLIKETEPTEHFPWESIFVCGYGVNRGTGKRSESPPSNYSRPEALVTLFDDNATLLDPEDTLRALRLAEIEASSDGRSRFKQVCLDLKALLELEAAEPFDVSSVHVRIRGPWGTLPFHALGDGYRGTAGWFLDFCRRAHIADRDPNDSAIVLIDEIDEHLHPSWQKNLVPLLKKRFPRIQFVGTTHSAMSIVNSGPNELLVSSLDNTIAHIRPLSEPEGKTADAILRGEWFGLTSTLDSESEKLLRAYESAVTAHEPEEKIALLRNQLRERLGRLVESPIDQLAIEIADEVRRQGFEGTSLQERKDRISAAAHLLRDRLKKMDVSP